MKTATETAVPTETPLSPTFTDRPTETIPTETEIIPTSTEISPTQEQATTAPMI